MRETWLTGTTSLPEMLRCATRMGSVCTSHQCQLLSAVLVAEVGRPELVCDQQLSPLAADVSCPGQTLVKLTCLLLDCRPLPRVLLHRVPLQGLWRMGSISLLSTTPSWVTLQHWRRARICSSGDC